MSFDLKLENGDLKIQNGDLQLVQNNEKLIQDALKILLTPLGGNKAHPWYGCNIGQALIGGVFDKEFTMDVATQQVVAAMENLQILQKSQSKTQVITAAETIAAIKDVYINSNPKDQTVIELKVTLLTNALTIVPVRFYVNLS